MQTQRPRSAMREQHEGLGRAIGFVEHEHLCSPISRSKYVHLEYWTLPKLAPEYGVGLFPCFVATSPYVWLLAGQRRGDEENGGGAAATESDRGVPSLRATGRVADLTGADAFAVANLRHLAVCLLAVRRLMTLEFPRYAHSYSAAGQSGPLGFDGSCMIEVSPAFDTAETPRHWLSVKSGIGATAVVIPTALAAFAI